MTCRSDSLVVGDVVVRQDAHGRFSLNDLHRASGGEARHAPGQFFRHVGVRALIEEIRCANPHIAPVESVRGGYPQGTFATRIVALRYAAWISAPFEHKVYRVLEDYLDGLLVPAAPALAVPATYPEALRLAADLYEKNAQQAALIAQQGQVIEEQKPAVDFLDRFVAAKGTAGVRQVAKRINRKQNELVEELLRDKVLYRSEGKLTPFSEYQAKGYFVVKNGEKNGKAFGHARFTPEGITWAGLRYGREAPGENSPPALPAGTQQTSQLALLPESTQ